MLWELPNGSAFLTKSVRCRDHAHRRLLGHHAAKPTRHVGFSKSLTLRLPSSIDLARATADPIELRGDSRIAVEVIQAVRRMEAGGHAESSIA